MTTQHRLLARQIKRHLGSPDRLPEEYASFMNAVNEAYEQNDIDRAMLERSLELSSQELLQANLEMRAIIHNLPDVLLIINDNGIILDCRSPLTGDPHFNSFSHVGQSLYDCIHDQIKSVFQRSIETVQDKKSPYGMDYSLDINGEKSFYEARIIPLRENQIMMIIRNITERKTIEEAFRLSEERYRILNDELEHRVTERTVELRLSYKELEAFSYSVSHDLRTPLRAIDGFSRILSEEYESSLAPDAQRLINLVRSNAQMMGRLLDDLHNFLHIGRKPLRLKQIPLKKMIHQVLIDFQQMQANRKIDISIEDMPDCMADPGMLRIVIANLLSNAIKFTKSRPIAHISLGTVKSGDETCYFIRDDGVGFNMQYSEKIFAVFQRLHRADEYEGTGVGMAVVQRIIHKHGGRIWVESEPDKGTVFYFTLGRGDTSGISGYRQTDADKHIWR